MGNRSIFGSNDKKAIVANILKSEIANSTISNISSKIDNTANVNVSINQNIIGNITGSYIKGDIINSNTANVSVKIVDINNTNVKSVLSNTSEADLQNIIKQSLKDTEKKADSLGLATIANGISKLYEKSSSVSTEFKNTVENSVKNVVQETKSIYKDTVSNFMVNANQFIQNNYNKVYIEGGISNINTFSMEFIHKKVTSDVMDSEVASKGVNKIVTEGYNELEKTSEFKGADINFNILALLPILIPLILGIIIVIVAITIGPKLLETLPSMVGPKLGTHGMTGGLESLISRLI